MSPDEIRELFPAVRHLAYFNAASQSPMPVPVADAVSGVTASWVDRGILSWGPNMKTVEAARARAAALVGAELHSVAFVANTTEGISRVAAGIDWRPGDEVVVGDLEYPANVYPWALQQDRGVRLRVVPSERGRLPAGRFADAVTPRTRVVAVSMVQFSSGYRIDLEEIAGFCRERDVLLVVDAIQGLGVYPVDVRALGIAALAAEGRKWLWAPPGSGFLYVDPERLGAIRPATAGAQSVRNFDDFLQWVALVDAEGRLDLGGLYREGAGRFESGFPNVACVAGLGAALELGDRIGRDAIRNTVDRLVARLVAGLAERGWPVHGPVAAEERSGIVSFEVPGDAERAFHALNAAGCTLGLRDGRLRAAPHAYNTADEVDRLLDLLDGLVAGA